MIIDFHTHIFPPWVKERREEYVRRDACFALHYSPPKAKMATAEELITGMDEAEVDLSVALNIGWLSHDLCRETNDYILDAVSRYPDRLIGFCGIQPKAGDLAVAEVERCARAGARGVGELKSDVQGFDLTDEAVMKPIVDMMVKYDMIFLTHSSEPVGHQYIGKSSVTPDILYSFILSFPDLKVVCAHWGGGLPFYALMPEVAKAFSSVFFDTAATVFLYQPKIFKQVSELVGSEKILFGSDYPLVSASRIISQVKSAELTPEERDRILWGNAHRLLSGVERNDLNA